MVINKQTSSSQKFISMLSQELKYSALSGTSVLQPVSSKLRNETEEGPDGCKSQIMEVILHLMAFVECTMLRKIKRAQFTAWMQEGLIKLCP